VTALYAPIARRTLHDEVLDRLRDMIIEGHLGPGQRINEGAVGAQLGVSRTPLREAIKSLTAEGLVEIVPAKGAVVRKFTVTDLAQILEVLKSLEQLGGRLACAGASDAAIEDIHDLHRRMMALYEARERLGYFKLNQAIHTAIVAASGNAVLVGTHATLQSRIKRLRFVGHEGPEKWAGAVAEHEAMMVGLLARDADGLCDAIGRHMDAALTRVREVL
jgi:DNA-binding GntR family transcriptional regulator